MAKHLALVAILLGGVQSSGYVADIARHRAERERELRADDGWLTVAGLFWLKPGRNVAGSAPGSDIVLPAKAPARLGVFELADGKVTFSADPAARVTVRGQRVTTRALDVRAGEREALRSADLVMFPIVREDRVGLRLRDVASPARRTFKGLDYYPVRPEYRVVGKFTLYPAPRRLTIQNVLGQTPEMENPGYVTFTLNGRQLRLDPVYETDERADLFFMFKDLTSRRDTYPAGRYLHAALPTNGEVILDFNKAYNPPCAFTDYATCPLPPKQNELPVAIEAGERTYHAPKPH
jgi:uncharacterized protein